MRHVISAVLLAVAVLSCSPKQDQAGQSAAVRQVEKTESYFRSRYGAPKSEKRVTEFSFPLITRIVHWSQPMIIQEYEQERLRISVFFSGTSGHALWIKYALPDAWTEAQINAALESYGSGWKITKMNVGMALLLRERAPAAYRSAEGMLAHKNMVNELMFYDTQFETDLLAKISDVERQKRAVPQF